MEIVLGLAAILAVLVLIVAVMSRKAKAEQPARQLVPPPPSVARGSVVGGASAPATRTVSPQAPRSTLKPVRTPPNSEPLEARPIPLRVARLSASGRIGVAGEWYRTNALDLVAGTRDVPPTGQWDAAALEDAFLLSEPGNKHDRHAVQVFMLASDRIVAVGYLPADRAQAWQPVVRSIEAEGLTAVARAALYRDADGLSYQVVLRLGDPALARFQNDPCGAFLLSAERECAVTEEQLHQDELKPYTSSARPIWATLHHGPITRGKYANHPGVEVRLDGQRVGVLTHAQGQRYGKLLDLAPTVAAEACLVARSGRWDIVLMLPKVD